MSKTPEQRAYARGYHAGAKWPLHAPPAPPVPVVAEALAAAKDMRDWIDGQLAMGAYEEGDVGALIDRFDAAMGQIGIWIHENAGG